MSPMHCTRAGRGEVRGSVGGGERTAPRCSLAPAGPGLTSRQKLGCSPSHLEQYPPNLPLTLQCTQLPSSFLPVNSQHSAQVTLPHVLQSTSGSPQ